MSYCRFSSDDFQCDVYCYESNAGFITHVASNRPVIDRSLLPPVVAGDFVSYGKRLHAAMDLLEGAKRVNICCGHDGKTFTDSSASEAASTLRMLKSCGYNVPQFAIDALDEEAKADAVAK